jgi:oligopeptide/dipeptide ABC transporter ATP-binding protein
MAALSAAPLLETRGLVRHFGAGGPFSRGVLKAVDGIDLAVPEHATLSLVGESGCGKSTTANLILGLDTPTAGEIRWRGRDIAAMSPAERRAFRRETSAVFQDPLGSLDPRIRIGASIAQPLRQFGAQRKAQRRRLVEEALVAVGLRPEHARRFPHEFSGGQRQRIAIARALVTRPALIVLDEPVASLDLSIQAQIMNLLKRLQAETGISYLMISHNLATVRFLSDTIAVLYLGRVVEYGPSEVVLTDPQHPYTRVLIAAARATEGGAIDELGAFGELPSPYDMPRGCPFHPRCPFAVALCREAVPPLAAVPGGALAACHLAQAGTLPAAQPEQQAHAAPPPAAGPQPSFAQPSRA